ncbi:hypothetical protein N7481_004409 [Penicillium waksmanii]|uniref:uncharacterized protein n=1 Tax=Penicillium waksmanii TaxID=69791 RepID=UPI002547C234|nr:uncharacterized protein N7481_004409 [Penicillium waksmanii]KAJ5989199.1 hypothetical protein N7481_004409 [Penicillium waksmanii]
MVQRTKVLDTEGTTPKFLYSMIKQLDLKLIDWNKVAQDLEISNGHAARMRYSRFRSQMDGPNTAQRAPRRRGQKKGAKGDVKGNSQMPFAQVYPGLVPKLESPDYMSQPGPFVKHEHGSQKLQNSQSLSDVSDLFQFSPMMASSGIQYPYVPSYIHHGIPINVGNGVMSPGHGVLGSIIGSFGTPSYSQFAPSQDFSIHSGVMTQSTSDDAPAINWGLHAPLDEQDSSEISQIEFEQETELIDLKNEVLPDKATKQEVCTPKAEERTSSNEE